MRKFIALFASAIVIVLIAVSCSAPQKMSVPIPVEIPMPPPPEIKKKMCVGHDCRKLGAGDITGTTRGHTDDEEN